MQNLYFSYCFSILFFTISGISFFIFYFFNKTFPKWNPNWDIPLQVQNGIYLCSHHHGKATLNKSEGWKYHFILNGIKVLISLSKVEFHLCIGNHWRSKEQIEICYIQVLWCSFCIHWAMFFFFRFTRDSDSHIHTHYPNQLTEGLGHQAMCQCFLSTLFLYRLFYCMLFFCCCQ